jgi:hypothetical protein
MMKQTMRLTSVFVMQATEGLPVTTLESLVANFRLFSWGEGALIQVPVILPAYPGRSWLESLGLHLGGWDDRLAGLTVGKVNDLRQEGIRLLADLEEVPVDLAAHVGKNLHVMAEYWTDFEGHGPTLRTLGLFPAVRTVP